MNRKFIGITVGLALVLVLFLYGKERGWFKKNPTGNNEENPPNNTGNIGEPPVGAKNTGIGKTPAPKPKPTNGTNTKPGTGSTIKPGNFNADEQARDLHKKLSSWFDPNGEDEKAFEIILSYSDTQLKDVAKAWSKIYLFGNGNFSLYQMVDAEAVIGRPSVMDKKIKIIDKMRRLGVDKIQY